MPSATSQKPERHHFHLPGSPVLLAAFLFLASSLAASPATGASSTTSTAAPALPSTSVTMPAVSTSTTLAPTTTRPTAPGPIRVDVASIVSVCDELSGDTITVPDFTVGSQPGRILVVTVGGEGTDADCDLGAPGASVRWAGLELERAISTVTPSESFRTCNAIFYLIDPPAGTADAEIQFPSSSPGPIHDRHAGAFVIYNAAPAPPITVAASARDDEFQPTMTEFTVDLAGSLVADIVTNGNQSYFIPWNGRQIERWQQSCGGSSSAAATMRMPSPVVAIAGWFNTDPRRYAHSLAVFAPAGAASTTTLPSSTSTSTTHAPLCNTDAECDDGDVCNGIDACIAGRCVTAAAPECDDGLFCNGIETCVSGLGCIAGAAPVCIDGVDCTLDACDEDTAACSFTVDDDACNDSNPCTDDMCSAASGCLNTANAASCDDGVYCNGLDTCADATCSIHAGDPCANAACEATCDETTRRCLGAGGLPCDEIDSDNDGLADMLDPCPADARNLCFGPVAVDLMSGRPIRINAGTPDAPCGGALVDCRGQSWAADFGYNQSGHSGVCGLGGGGSNCVIDGLEQLFGCEDDATANLFRCEHWDGAGGSELAYGFLVPNGEYVVNLFFANTFSGTATVGTRTFDIIAQGVTAYDDFDQVEAAGASARAVVRSVVVSVSDHVLLLGLSREIENPALKAIEVLTSLQPVTTTTTTSTTLADCLSDAECDDGNACNGDERCGPAGCTPGLPPVCNDGLFCNGEESCDPSVGCTSGAPPVCDDDVACTDDACDEVRDGCVNVSACAADEICHAPIAACIAPTGDGDGDGLDDAVDPCPAEPLNRCFGPVAIDTATGQPIRLNAGRPSAACAGPKTDCGGESWQADFGFNAAGNSGACMIGGGGAGCAIAGLEALFGCSDESTADLLRCEHWDGPGGEELSYEFVVPDGDYLVNLFFANTFTGTDAAGDRVFDILVEGANVHPRFDQVAAAGATATAVLRSAPVVVRDGTLDIQLRHVIENPSLKAIEVLTSTPPTTTTTLPSCDRDCADDLDVSPALIAWGHVPLGAEQAHDITLTNVGPVDVQVDTLTWRVASGEAHDFHALVGGQNLPGGDGVTQAIALVVPAGAEVMIPVTFSPTATLTNSVGLVFRTAQAAHEVSLLATGGDGPDDPFLHVVIATDTVAVDRDGDGSEQVMLSAGESHTHEPGRSIAAYEWRLEDTVVADTISPSLMLPVGEHRITLTIFDDDAPAKSLSDSITVRVTPADAAPGVVALYHLSGTADDALALLDAVPATADHGEIITALRVDAADGPLGASPFSAAGNGNGVMIRMIGAIEIDEDGVYDLSVAGGDDYRLFIDGIAVVGPMALAARRHDVEARFAVNDAADLAVEVLLAPLGATAAPIDPTSLTHDETMLTPVINSMTDGGGELGGDPVLITGLGYFPEESVVVQWGDAQLATPAISVTPTAISLTSPPGIGAIDVTVSTSAGVSNRASYAYTDDAPPPIRFTTEQLDVLDQPTQAAWGPDGRLYVASTTGTITAYTFDDDYAVLDRQVIDVLAISATPDILGIAFDPLAVPGDVAIYVAHSRIFAKGGVCNFAGEFAYIGRISRITGPDFSTLEPVITGLPTSNHDHAVNGIAFDNEGNLLVAVGGNTNAGIAACAFGAVPESPLSGAVLIASLGRSGFDGAVSYVDRDTGLPSADQLAGDRAELARGGDVRVWAPGFRNSFDLVYTTAGRIYNTDNGPDMNLGPASTGPDTQAPDPTDIDSLGHVVEGGYHGHPNRNRGRLDPRQNVYHDARAVAAPGELEPALATFNSSVNGIDEYRAATFAGAMRGQLLVQKWNGVTHRIELSPDGDAVASVAGLPVGLQGLDVLAGPAGALLGVDFTDDRLVLARPADAGAVGVTAYDVFPWRAPHTGGVAFVIGGSGFGTIDDTTVTFGGAPATVTSVSTGRIHGIVPAAVSASPLPVDVVVTVDGESDLLADAFTYLADPRVDTGTSAELLVDGRGSLATSSTFASSSFVLRNTSSGDRSIVRARVDLTDAVLRDLAFDPAGSAGDPLGKDLTIDSSTGPAVSAHTWQRPLHGGYAALDLELSGFTPGQSLTFSVDIDPTSIRGAPAPGPGQAGSLAGSELTGATFTAWFDDGSVHHGDLFADPVIETAARARAAFAESPRPTVEVLGLTTPAATAQAGHSIRVSGPAGERARVIVLETALETSTVPGGGFDLQPWESNTVLAIEHREVVLDDSGSADVAITLRRSNPAGGLNLIVAALDDGGRTGRVSIPTVVELLP